MIFGVLVFCFTVQLVFWVVFYKTSQRLKGDGLTVNKDPKVSVIICAKNAAITLPSCIDSIVHQNYSNYDIIVVDDYSEDNTPSIIESYQNNHSNLKCIHPSQNIEGKKLAIIEAVTQSDAEWIVMTDADCVASSERWVQSLMSTATQNINLILGFGDYEKKSGFLNRLIRFETLYIAIQYYSAAIMGRAYMGVGRNIAFRRSAFLEKRPFDSNMDVTSGDDDAIVAAIATKTNVALAINPLAKTISKPEDTFISYWKQKRRHIQPSFRYNIGTKVSLGLLGGSYVFFFVAVICTLLYTQHYYWVFALVLIRWIVIYSVVHKWNKLLRNTTSDHFLLVDVGLSVSYLIQSVFLPLGKKEW